MTEEDLDQQAMEEILRDAKRRKDMSKEYGVGAYIPNQNKSINKRFLRNIVSESVSSNTRNCKESDKRIIDQSFSQAQNSSNKSADKSR